MKYLQLIHSSIIITLIISIPSCTNFGENQAPIATTLPPPNTSNMASLAPEMGKQETIDNEQSIKKAESQEIDEVRITEERSTGGSLDKITVHNPSKLPDYYLFPPQQTDQNDLPNQNMSIPTWQITW